ncbi:FMN-linked oxidoreductase [Parathielavia hyrcaniae]|uniref:FMN-linked oxidoreductase n=1 Tax=Parathielavia hyrcaniae TaxID=113614 RepID=A0AAN6PUU4_9PEZI|nr:FMN-linked oxidoreductase [Parathielavia hyrcaniae]
MAPPSNNSRLFEPLRLTPNITLSHRIAMAPLTRFRADDDHVPTVPLMATYYAQRASLPGTLLVTEATFVSPSAGGYGNVPGIYTPAQVAAWRQVTDAVHARGGFVFCQLWSLGRAASAAVAAREGFRVHSSSAVPMDEHPGTAVPEEMTVAEIRERVKEYAAAARNAIEAGFDGVEVHGANGYLIDQFIQDTCNRRVDEYGGSVENRSRFAVEVVKAVVEAVGAERTGIRLSPWSTFQGMRMKDPVPQFEDVIRKISGFGLAYLHLIRGRIAGNADTGDADGDSLDFAAKLWDGPLLIAGELAPQSARTLVDEEFKDKNVVAVFGRWYISTPDLPFRIKEGIELNPYDRHSFYTPKSPVGYIDQSFSKEYEALHGVQTLNSREIRL